VRLDIEWLERIRWPPSGVIPSLVTTSESQRRQGIDASSWPSTNPPHAVPREPWLIHARTVAAVMPNQIATTFRSIR